MRYKIIKASDDGTFLPGDEITFYRDGSIGCRQAGGWIDPEYAADALDGAEYVEIMEPGAESAMESAWQAWHGGCDGYIPVVSTAFRRGFLAGLMHVEQRVLGVL
jgi:hypothetical protein